MATRSTIAVKLADGRVREVYCHWDGYIDHNGKLLYEIYNTQDLAEALTEPGDISSLGERIEPIGAHSFDSPQSGVTVYYGRDRGEEGTNPKYFPSVEAYKRDLDGEEYDYLFADGEWTVRYYGTKNKWISLAAAIAAEAAEQEAAD